MNVMKRQIIKIFSDNPFNDEYFLNGFYQSGESKSWTTYDGTIQKHCYYNEKGQYEGEFKTWYDHRDLNHNYYVNGVNSRMPKNIKDGYILVKGKYYPD